MLTIFTHPKAFRGPAALIQRNALRSWLRLHPDVQIILFGDAIGALEVAWEFGLHYEESPKLTDCGAIRLDYMFATALRHARHDVLCYLPCDTLLLQDFCIAFNRVEALYREFVMVGRCRNLELDAVPHFGDPDCEARLKLRCERRSAPAPSGELGYVVFSRGCFQNDIAALPCDSPAAMNWLVRKAIAKEVAVVDATHMVIAVQQSQHAERASNSKAGSLESSGEERLLPAGNYRQLRRAVRAPLVLTAEDVIPNRWVRLRRWHASITQKRRRSFQDWGELSLGTRKAPAASVVEARRPDDGRP